MILKYKKSNVGMTLIELLIVIGILGALTAIAIPSFSQHLIKAERKRAQTDLYQLKIWTEQEFTEKGEYPSEIACSLCELSDEYNYSIEAGSDQNNQYKLKATPKTTSIQNNDKECHTMIINTASEKSNISKDGTALENEFCWI